MEIFRMALVAILIGLWCYWAYLLLRQSRKIEELRRKCFGSKDILKDVRVSFTEENREAARQHFKKQYEYDLEARMLRLEEKVQEADSTSCATIGRLREQVEALQTKKAVHDDFEMAKALYEIGKKKSSQKKNKKP